MTSIPGFHRDPARQHRGQCHRAAGFDHQPQILRRPALCASAISSSLTATPVASRRERTSKVSGETRVVISASHAVGGGFVADGLDPRRLQAAAHVVPALGLDHGDPRIAQAERDPADSPPPPHGTTMCMGSPSPAASIWRRASIPATSLPLDDPGIVEARHQRRAARLRQLPGDRLAALASRGRISRPRRRAPAYPPVWRTAHLRASRSSRNARVSLGRPGDPLRMIAAGKGDDAARRASSSSAVSRCHAPRILNAPIGCSDSALNATGHALDFGVIKRRRRQDRRDLRGGVAHPGTGGLSHDGHASSLPQFAAKTLYMGGSWSYMPASAAPWDFQPQGSDFRN